MRHLLALALSSAGLLLAAPAAAACTSGPFTVDWPAQRMDERLQALAHTTGCFVRFDPARFGALPAPRLRGRLATDALLVHSVRGTGLEANRTRNAWHVDRAQQDRFGQRIASLSRTIDACHLPPHRAAMLHRDLRRVRQAIADEVRTQGFLSAAERAGHTRALDAAAARIAR